MKTVTRADLFEAAYQTVFGPSRHECEEVVRQTIDEIGNALVAGDKVLISRFGSFAPRRKQARVGRNPKQPAEEHTIPAHVALVFRAANELKAAVAPILNRPGGYRENEV